MNCLRTTQGPTHHRTVGLKARFSTKHGASRDLTSLPQPAWSTQLGLLATRSDDRKILVCGRETSTYPSTQGRRSVQLTQCDRDERSAAPLSLWDLHKVTVTWL